MTPEDLVEKLKVSLPNTLRSVVLYGSAATGDFVEKRSDYNVLIVADRLGLTELKALSKPTGSWVRVGNPPPLLFTLARLKNSADVFPIELFDIKESHRILFGADVLEEIEVSRAHLRHQLEHELKAKLIQLREGYLTTGGSAKAVVELMVQSLSSFLVLFRGALRLFESSVPAAKLEALKGLNRYIEFDTAVFEIIHDLKTGRRSAKEFEADTLFERYLNAIETVVDEVDRRLQRGAVHPPQGKEN